MLTKQNIQRGLFTELNKRKGLAIWLTAILFVSIVCYVLYIAAYINGANLHNDHLSFSVHYVTIPIGAFVILFLAIFLVCYYYLDLYKIKNGKIEFTEETLYQKTIESVSYYHAQKRKTHYISVKVELW